MPGPQGCTLALSEGHPLFRRMLPGHWHSPTAAVAPLDTSRDCIDKRKWIPAIAAQAWDCMARSGCHSAAPAERATNCGADRGAGLLIRALHV